MLNAPKNARIIGILLILFGVYDSMNGLKGLTDFLNRGNTIIAEDLFWLMMTFLAPIISIVVGFGLFKSKLWAVYGLALLAVATIAGYILAADQETISKGNLIAVGIYILLFIWFYSSKKGFVK